MNKLKTILLAVLVLAGVAACKDETKSLLTFYINQEVNSEFKSGLLAGTVLQVLPVTVASNTQDEFKNNNTRADLVKDITLEKAVLNITDPDGEDFTFLESIRIYAATNDNNEVLVAYRDNIPNTVGDTLHLISTQVKLDEYVKSESYKIRTEARLKKASRNMKVRTDMRFKVVADPL